MRLHSSTKILLLLPALQWAVLSEKARSGQNLLLNHLGKVPGTILDLTLPEPYLNVNSELDELLLTCVPAIPAEMAVMQSSADSVGRGGQSC